MRIGRLTLCWTVIVMMTCAASADEPSQPITSRPGEPGSPTRVETGVFIIDVDRIDTVNQSFDANVFVSLRWRDPRLAHGGPGSIRVPLQEVWHPRVQFINQKRIVTTFADIAEIAPDGEVTYRQRAWGAFSQPLHLADFPFDRQSFTVRLAAAGFTPSEVEFVSSPALRSGIADVLSLADWHVLSWDAKPERYEPVPGDEGPPGYVFTFEAQRKQAYYIVKVIVPLILIVAMSWVVFWVEPQQQASSQISVAVTCMLTLIAYRFAVGAYLPNLSYLTRLDSFILGATILVFASLVEVVATSVCARTGRLTVAQTMDKWARWLFPVIFLLFSLDTLVFGFVF